MATADVSKDRGADIEAVRAAWLALLGGLVAEVERWAGELGWSTRRIEKKLEDHELGTHRVPALLLQREAVRILLDPIARDVPGSDGVVDLYLMPAFDDVATLSHTDGEWRLHYAFPGTPTVHDLREAQWLPLTKAILDDVLQRLIRDVG